VQRGQVVTRRQTKTHGSHLWTGSSDISAVSYEERSYENNSGIRCVSLKLNQLREVI
jgi:hypothetical protein